MVSQNLTTKILNFRYKFQTKNLCVAKFIASDEFCNKLNHEFSDGFFVMNLRMDFINDSKRILV